MKFYPLINLCDDHTDQMSREYPRNPFGPFRQLMDTYQERHICDAEKCEALATFAQMMILEPVVSITSESTICGAAAGDTEECSGCGKSIGRGHTHIRNAEVG